MKKILFLAALVGTVLAGCSKDKEKDDGKMDVLVCMHYDSNKPERHTNIIAMLPDGTGQKMLYAYSDEIRPKQGSIGSDGKTLIFATQNNKGVYTFDLSNGTLVKLSVDGDWEAPVFSPDMSKVYVLNDDSDEFCSINVATKAVTVLNDGSERSLNYPSFTADGRIVCDAYWWGDIGIMNADGTNLTVLKNKEGYIFYLQPFAIPARNKIVYCEFYEDNPEYFCSVRIMNTDGTGDAVLIPKGANDEHFANPNTNAAGNKMVYSHMTESHNKRGDIIICDFNGTALSNKKTIYTDNGGNIQIWRAMFSRIDKAVYNALPNAN